ncbi:serine/threonine-protein phosphatase, partial [Actinomadura fulvescens]
GPRRWTWLVVTAGVVVVALAAGGFATVKYLQDGYYIGAENGHVVLFRGTSQKVPGLPLSKKAAQKDQPNPPILVADLPADRAKAVQDTYPVKGSPAVAVNDLKTAVCKYSLQQEAGKVVIVKGKEQKSCREAKVKGSELKTAELPQADADAVEKGMHSFIGVAGAERKLAELTTLKERCAAKDPQVKDCPQDGADKP